MASLPIQVNPGDIITSDLINAMLSELAQLRGSGTGGQVVPNVFGMFLADARTIITQPSRQLSMGFTFDVTGAAIDPLSSGGQNRIVLNQSPVADMRVAPNTPVNLVVSAAATTGTPAPAPAPAPTITGFLSANGAAVTAAAVNSNLVIVGSNFSANASQNTVRFDGLAVPSTPNVDNPSSRLQVVVPVGIPNGAPQNPGDPPRSGVPVTVTRVGSTTTASRNITIDPPVPNAPTITEVRPATPEERQLITIIGTNFTPQTTVFFETDLAGAVPVQGVVSGSIQPTEIAVTVPELFAATQGSSLPVTVRVRVSTNPSLEAIFRFRVFPV